MKRLPDELKERIKNALRNHRKMGHSKRDAIEKTSEIFQQANPEYIEHAADQVYDQASHTRSQAQGSRRRDRQIGGKPRDRRNPKQPEMMEASGGGGNKITDLYCLDPNNCFPKVNLPKDSSRRQVLKHIRDDVDLYAGPKKKKKAPDGLKQKKQKISDFAPDNWVDKPDLKKDKQVFFDAHCEGSVFDIEEDMEELGDDLDNNSENLSFEFGKRYWIEGRETVEVKVDVNGEEEKFLMYHSTGSGSSGKGRGDWVPIPGFFVNVSLGRLWFKKSKACTNDPPYGSSTFKVIGEELAKHGEDLFYNDNASPGTVLNKIAKELQAGSSSDSDQQSSVTKKLKNAVGGADKDPTVKKNTTGKGKKPGKKDKGVDLNKATKMQASDQGGGSGGDRHVQLTGQLMAWRKGTEANIEEIKQPAKHAKLEIIVNTGKNTYSEMAKTRENGFFSIALPPEVGEECSVEIELKNPPDPPEGYEDKFLRYQKNASWDRVAENKGGNLGVGALHLTPHISRDDDDDDPDPPGPGDKKAVIRCQDSITVDEGETESLNVRVLPMEGSNFEEQGILKISSSSDNIDASLSAGSFRAGGQTIRTSIPGGTKLHINLNGDEDESGYVSLELTTHDGQFLDSREVSVNGGEGPGPGPTPPVPMPGGAVSVGLSILLLAVLAIVLRFLNFSPEAYGLFITGAFFLAVERFLSEDPPLLYVKAFLRPVGILFIVGSLLIFFGNRPVFRLIPLFIAAGGLFYFPRGVTTQSKESENFEKIMSIVRSIYSFVLLIVFLYTFRAAMAVPKLFASLACLSVAFFLVFPRNVVDSSTKGLDKFEEFGKKIGKGMSEGADQSSSTPTFVKVLYWLVVILFFGSLTAIVPFMPGAVSRVSMVLLSSVVGVLIVLYLVRNTPRIAIQAIAGLIGLVIGAWAVYGSIMGFVIFLSVVSSGLLVAIPVPEVRPVMGVIILPMALVAATATYPDVMGESVFGEWWPTVKARTEELEKSVSPAMSGFTEMQDTLGTGWQCLSSPMDCYNMYEAEGEVEKDYQALKLSRLEPIGVGRVDEDYQFSSAFSIKNTLKHGDYLNPPVIENLNLSANQAEFIGKAGDDNTASDRGKIIGPLCERGGESKCKIGDLNPGVEHQYQVEYEGEDFGGEYTEPEPGDQLRYGVDAEYTVDTASVLDVEVMNSSEFMEQSRRGELEYQNPRSTYEWGPVEIGMAASRQQPIMGGSEIPLLVTLKNRDDGRMSADSIDVNITTTAGDGEFVESGDLSEENCNIEEKLDEELSDLDGYLEPKDSEHNSITVSCNVYVKEVDEVPSKTYDLRIDMEYTYEMETKSNIEVMFDDSSN